MKQLAPRLTIGALSKATGCNVETIRYYEQVGVLEAPARSEGGHRRYTVNAVKRLNFVLCARKLGFSPDTVRGLLALADGEGQTCAEVERIAARHLGDVRSKLDDLAAMEGVLAKMVALCKGGSLPECPIIEALFDEST